MARGVSLLTIIYLAFVSLGLPDGILGVAWPSMRGELGQPLDRVGFIVTLLLWLSALSSITSGVVLRRWGTGAVTAISGLMTGLALLGYALAPGFWWLLLFTIPLGLGQGAVDSGLNLYVANHYSARHMNWLHCFWGVGASGGPMVMTLALGLSTWRLGYGVIAGMQLALAGLLWWSVRVGLWHRGTRSADAGEEAAPKGILTSSVHQAVAVLLFFLYVGMEYAMGLWLNSLLVESRHVAAYKAGLVVSAFYAAIMAGRFLSGVVVSRTGNMGIIRGGLLLSAGGLACLWLSGSLMGMLAGAVLTGLGFAPVYPCLMHETPRRFRADVTTRLMGWQVGAACLGGSLVSSGLGVFMAQTSLEWLCPVLLGLVIVTALGNEFLGAASRGCAENPE